MKKELPLPVIAVVIVVVCVILGAVAWHFAVPETVIADPRKMPPAPDYRIGAQQQRALTPPDYRTGASTGQGAPR